ncbi:hypothetical protein LUZ60_006920 [Juncus effusus]|nr:hypothetical protein LUZ60_006920 [Juncus effusus]
MGVFFLFLISSFLIPTMILASSTDSEIDLPALLSFKSLISNDPTGLLFSWNETIHYCNWPGVTCGHSHPERVISLVLESFQLSGYISPSVGNLTFLQNLSLYDNQFAGNIPEEIGRCRRLRFLDMRINSLDGNVPPTVSNCTSLEVIYLRHNYLQGEIPSSFEGLQSVTGLGLAVNQLSGEIPAILGQLQFLEILLLEDNNLSGKRHSRRNLQVVSIITPHYKRVSYDEIHRATNGFSSEYLIGTGKFGAVYKAVMSFENVTTVAVKVLNLGQHGASRHFISECEALRHVKHRNLVKVLSSCSSIDNHGNDFNALIFEFMFNGKYGMGGTASEQGDIYSYGVLLLELFIGISPTNDRFKDGLNLHKFVEASFPNKIMDIIDSKLYINDEENSENVIKSFHDCLVLVIRCGLLCSKESPQERARIKEVIRDLNSARMKLQRQER